MTEDLPKTHTPFTSGGMTGYLWFSHVFTNTVDGRNPANQFEGTVVYPIIYRVLYIPSGAGFLPSTV